VCTHRTKSETVSHRNREVKNTLRAIRRNKSKWIGHKLCMNCLLKHMKEGNIEGEIEVPDRQ
jgi:hypothetical protein